MFSRSQTPKEQMREQKREFSRTQRDLQRDRNDIDRQEKVLIAEIQKMAKQGNEAAAKTLAKQLVRLREQKTKSVAMSARLTGIQAQTTAIHSNLKVAGAMTGATKVLTSVNKQMDVTKMQQTMQEFQKQSMHMDMSEELMNDTIDSVMEGSDDEEESNNIMNQVLDEIGIEVGAKLTNAPRHAIGEASSSSTSDLEEIRGRMSKLKE